MYAEPEAIIIIIYVYYHQSVSHPFLARGRILERGAAIRGTQSEETTAAATTMEDESAARRGAFCRDVRFLRARARARAQREKESRSRHLFG